LGSDVSAGFTPGPWSTGVDGNNRIYGPDGAGLDSGLVAVVYKGRANTDLIAAAPDLYEALQSLLDDLDTYGYVTVRRDSNARSAIAKARGKQS